jgi:YD repeat-containing protein
MANDGVNTLVYDAENRLLSFTSGSTSETYRYDGHGRRVKKVSGRRAARTLNGK